MANNLERVLRLMAEKNASDVYLSANTPILIKIHGQILQLSDQLLTHAPDAPAAGRAADAAAARGARRHRRAQRRHRHAARRQLPPVGLPASAARSRRCSAASRSRSRRWSRWACRRCCRELVLEKRGLILMVGATGTGKSTTLASMLEWRNQQITGPHPDDRGPDRVPVHATRSRIVNQREVGRDTQSLQIALKNALRQAPDCILIGEIRDRETMTSAISYALSGHLVLATLHANNSYHALGRILSLLHARGAADAAVRPGRRACAPSSRSACCARNAGGRAPAVEVLLNTKLVSELIEQGDLAGVKEAMEKSLAEGSQTFEQDIARLISEGVISRDEGLAYADSPTNLLWRLQNEHGAGVAQPRRGQEGTSPRRPTFTEITIDVRASRTRAQPAERPPLPAHCSSPT
ncbi:MAG: Flp pilus assembly complex ATPase component TadA [Comamonadaceae bacterium]|nr:Flp pilus assembly complex ATPase component TadA [Comamonadaceae bacterium]